MKASILAIGTELTAGQITNKNATDLSAKLRAKGIEVVCHITVPDSEVLILSALDFASQRSDLLFVTGGLGPTSDDFTRDVIAKWSKSEMIFDESSWLQISDRLTKRGFQVREMQRQQCFFPKNSKILTNREGTANGFQLSMTPNKLEIYVLPGPPREIEAIWTDHIESDLNERTRHINKFITRSWDTLGLGESDVAYKVKAVTDNLSLDSFFEIGYRVHLPYVEVKFSYNEKDQEKFATTVNEIDAALDSITIVRDFKDIFGLTFKKLSAFDFVFYDFLTEGYFHNRISSYLRLSKNWSFKQSIKTSIQTVTADFFSGEDNFLALLPYDDISACLILSINGKFSQKVIEPPMKSPLMSERRLQYCAEMALIELYRCAIS